MLGLFQCKAIDEATERYELKNNMLKRFIKECVEIYPGSKVGARELYDHYKLWADIDLSCMRPSFEKL